MRKDVSYIEGCNGIARKTAIPFLNVWIVDWTLKKKPKIVVQAARMKVIIAGSRSITDFETVRTAITLAGFYITEVVSGACAGPDKLGEKWALENALPVKRFLPDWETHGRAAGPIRNSEMAKYADSLIAVFDGTSKGTQDMITKMQKADKQVFIYVPDPK